MIKFTVAIPVGPKASHKRWLDECIDSVLKQTYPADEILIIDDQAHLLQREMPLRLDSVACIGDTYEVHITSPLSWGMWRWYAKDIHAPYITYWPTPWLSGPVVGFNYGVMMAKNEWVLMLGSDDTLHPNALLFAKEAIADINDPLGHYNFSCHNSDSGTVTDWYNNAAVVSKALWRETGGMNPMTATGGQDAALLSIMMVHQPQHMHKIQPGVPLYYVRKHDSQYTSETTARYGTFVVQLRNDLTAEWQKPEWAR